MDEKQLEQERWYGEARAQSVETFPAFLAKLAAVEHSYDSIVHACAAAALAAVTALDRSPHGGITGFQASCVAWEIFKRIEGLEGQPLRMLRLREMLFPQYAYHFESVIDEETWQYLQKTARTFLAEKEHVSPSVRVHWESVVAGKVPFGWKVRAEGDG